ncbi:tRNA lysidine(34) synthetase TilS [Quisquiliibacterium transsilvanicum]|uniref:tRNA(Ile)-lysidine synthase n=1 Tax=Quisquiliibacterium transsilvanicum TaxID=1549638 RepID=A0A7W8MA41_9BURK|nr:tRNA lysidine(34) synthetase TilS [Quisquiliibacterium transsilvanicum]MBB5273686.1 tRNA(Ile)-lysidine synthase [Quisquiliibacterium transsilvanicum]
MENSRRSAKDADPVVAALARALGEACAAAGPLPHPPVFVIGWSGGLDSTVLLHAAASGAPAGARLVAVHVHHGLQPAADAWQAHCERESGRLGVACEIHRVEDAPAPGASVEAWARDRRYAALIRAAVRHGALGVLTAHHSDDQVETMLMRIARGSGVDGLAGIEASGRREGVPLLRPLLGLSRAELAFYAQRHGLRWVEDPSNEDPALLRNAFRHRVLPVMDAVAPAFRDNLLRLGLRLDEARAAIEALARIDLRGACVDANSIDAKFDATALGGCPGQRAQRTAGSSAAGLPADGAAPVALDADALARLPAPRRAAALRLWLELLGARAPTESKLREIERQLVLAAGAYGQVAHEGLLLRRHRRRIAAAPVAQGLVVAARDAVSLAWQGEPSLAVPGFAGMLQFDEDGPAQVAQVAQVGGVSAEWLRGRPLTVRSPDSMLRLRAQPGGRARTLKNLYQERGIPAWLRPSLPLVEADDRLLFAAGLGMDHSPGWPRTGRLVRLCWIAPHV